jgi:hypothetical protein
MEDGVLVFVSHDQLQFLDTIPVVAKLIGHHPCMSQSVIVTGKLTSLVIPDVGIVFHIEEITPHIFALISDFIFVRNRTIKLDMTPSFRRSIRRY